MNAKRAWLCAALAGLASCGKDAGPRSVLLVTFDTTRADRIGCYGQPNAGTPTIDALAARGVRFARALTPVPITLPAHASLMTASDPPYHGVRDNGTYRVAPELNTLAERLQSEGLRTAAFVSALPLESEFGLNQGFDYFDENRGGAGRDEHMHERRAEDTIERATIWLSDVQADEGFFMWVHLFDPHYPYAAPGEVDPAHDAYQAEISYADRQLGRLIAELEREGRLANTAIVMTADHGESLGEHGEISHGHLLYDGTQHIPLVMAGPEIETPRVIQGAVSLIDIAPTVTDWLGFDAPEFKRHGGRSLLSLLQGAPEASLVHSAIYMETQLPRLHSGWSELVGVEQGGWQLVHAPATGRSEWLDVRGGQAVVAVSQGDDNLPAQDLVPGAKLLRATLEDLLATLPPSTPFQSRALEIGDEEVLAGLEALGYLGISHEAIAESSVSLPDPRLQIGARAAAERLRHFLDLNQLTEAREQLAILRSIDPGGQLDAEFSGLVALAETPPDYAAARTAYDRATTLAPGRRNLWVQLASCQMELDDPDGALLSIQRAKALAPPSERILALEAILLRQTGAR